MWRNNASWEQHPVLKGRADTPALLPFGLLHPTLAPGVPQWDEASVAHGGDLLDNAPFLASFTFCLTSLLAYKYFLGSPLTSTFI